MSRNNPRTRFSTSVSKVLYEKLDRIAEVTGTQKTALVDEALELLVQKYRGRVLASGGEGVSIFMAKTIAFCSHRGGVGKTTSAAAFAETVLAASALELDCSGTSDATNLPISDSSV